MADRYDLESSEFNLDGIDIEPIEGDQSRGDRGRDGTVRGVIELGWARPSGIVEATKYREPLDREIDVATESISKGGMGGGLRDDEVGPSSSSRDRARVDNDAPPRRRSPRAPP